MLEVDDSRIGLFYVAVGRKVKSVRIEAGISQTLLAQKIGFNRSSIANLEAGRQRIALHLFFLIAEALGTPPAKLLPDIQLMEEAGSIAIENLNSHLVGTSETTQDFVRGTIARVTTRPLREGN